MCFHFHTVLFTFELKPYLCNSDQIKFLAPNLHLHCSDEFIFMSTSSLEIFIFFFHMGLRGSRFKKLASKCMRAVPLSVATLLVVLVEVSCLVAVERKPQNGSQLGRAGSFVQPLKRFQKLSISESSGS